MPNNWPRYPLVYEINTRVWLNELSARAGRTIKLDSVPTTEIDRIARMGFHAIWLMGVWSTGPEAIEVARTHPDLQSDYRKALPDFTIDDVIGSPYAVTNYEVSERLGGKGALANFRRKLEQFNLRLMLDFVPNHTSRDHRFVQERPEVYIQGTEEDFRRDPKSFYRTNDGHVIAFGRDPGFPAWTDTAQINYAQPAGRNAMKETLRNIAEQCDGVRCDMAMLLLPDQMERIWGPRLGPNPIRESFWREAIAEIQATFPNFIFLAESYWDLEWRLQQDGFNYTYDKTLYDRLRQGDNRGVKLHLIADKNFQDRCCRFIENHDEPRAAAVFGPPRSRCAAVASFFTPGMKLFHEGQLEGHRVKLPVQLGRRPKESEDVETALFYEKLLNVLQDPIFQNTTFTQREVKSAGHGDNSNDSLMAISWCCDKPSRNLIEYLIVVNLSNNRCYGRIPLPQDKYKPGTQYVFYDHQDGKRYERDGNELNWPGLYVALEGYQPHIFEISQK